jgi:polyisoprenoid-binding protein YceI
MKFAVIFAGLAVAAVSTATLGAQTGTLKIASAKVTITGTTNVHGYTAETATVRLTSVKTGPFDGDLMNLATTPALLAAFEIAIPSASLKSPKDGVDKNMHKALKAEQFKDITFRMTSLQKHGAGLRALGTLTIAGVSKEIALDLTARRAGSNLLVAGEIPLLMTDYGVTPPKAMLGMMKTDPKITISLELVLAASTS